MTGRIGSGRAALWGGIALLLLLPLVAMRFTAEVAWTGHDFAAAAVLLVGGGLTYELLTRRASGARQRAVAGGAILLAVPMIWAQGAVGIV